MENREYMNLLKSHKKMLEYIMNHMIDLQNHRNLEMRMKRLENLSSTQYKTLDGKLDSKFDELNSKMEKEFNNVNVKIDSQRKDIKDIEEILTKKN